MIKQYALIKSGCVEQVIVADADFVETIRAHWDHIELAPETVGVGWAWDGQAFAAPPAPDPGPQPTPARHISVGAFFDRFGAEKWQILADETAQCKAVIQDASVRKYIDLDNPDLPAGLAILQAAGHAIDPAAIIDAPVQPHELP
ncbi:hypothetical protein N5C96_29470 [Delftia tsuruhatensis]|uniref:hypothetical protein n=1 Tax=Delftia tsuruhatensis TaxID=180282 RepID=UPI0024453444|nr:hypothetical protein [Delftia tsuruhatensis]MDH0777550.1 hypothetical protein [Delftia tsuruhatensis]MDH1461886.1 hypothetical protein [Delftia tsuruhatensis]MDH1824601.1 hypothetical protein [Delftia tsuruhatensis]WGG09935.1 hypothetical protein N5O86_25325 [Delftia tsuruhatensis]